MSNELYGHINKAINGILNYAEDKTEVKKLRQEIMFANDQFIAFVWYMYQMAKGYAKRELGVDFGIMANAEGLQDVHIETALKQILKGYK